MRLLYTKLLHFGKSVPNLLRRISHSKVTADLVECPTAVFGFTWDDSDGMKGKRKDCTEGGTLPQLCAGKIKTFKELGMTSLLQRSLQSFTETHLHFRRPDTLFSSSFFSHLPSCLSILQISCFSSKNPDSNLLLPSHGYHS